MGTEKCNSEIQAKREFTGLKSKKNVGSATLGEAALLARRTPERFVSVADYISVPQAEKLRELNVSFFDAAGNAYFNEPGLYVFVSGRKAAVKPKKPIELFSPNGIKSLLAFLTAPKLFNHDYRSIAETIGVPQTSSLNLTDDLQIRAVSLAGLAVLKFIAYNDKPHERKRDLEDILFLMKNYPEAGSEERLSEDADLDGG